MFGTTQLIRNHLEITRRARSVTSTTRDQLALLGCRADAAPTAREGRAAALGLALIILEHEERILTRLKLRAHQLLIGRRIAPRTHAVLRHDILGVKVTDRLVALSISARILQKVIAKALARRTERTGSVGNH